MNSSANYAVRVDRMEFSLIKHQLGDLFFETRFDLSAYTYVTA